MIADGRFSFGLDDAAGHLPFTTHLFARVNELQSILRELDKVTHLPQVQQRAWLSEHEFSLPQLLDAYVHHLPDEFDDVKDTETMGLLFEYTATLQELSRVIHHLMHEHPKTQRIVH